jgi:hypothetical protein
MGRKVRVVGATLLAAAGCLLVTLFDLSMLGRRGALGPARLARMLEQQPSLVEPELPELPSCRGLPGPATPGDQVPPCTVTAVHHKVVYIKVRDITRIPGTKPNSSRPMSRMFVYLDG